ncbi:UPF0262 family protein [Sphingosinicella ginsenosidimutans]|uniref:UPF0262 protein FRZ32_01610 n=1 Tax=Allosphingosinicella ginsenosidimutans TaxID=1176539 RepID=A0A5C6TPZ9_9SPHN|nr:UPF0262 family protein [Sphingosinicella ginsenosidimutans]TXC62464.1 UPF0262 family protein [Sphingosinicella ginsenosidimutans]
MADPRIIDIQLDERSILKRNPDIEQERRIAIFDLLEANHFDVPGRDGPFRIALAVEEARLAIRVADREGAPLETIRVGLARLRRPIRDYFQICESYFRAVRTNGAKGIEAIDMARRGLHNDAAETLKDCLAGKVDVDFDTARRLFTLICVLHIRASTSVVDSGAAGPASIAG